MYKLLAVFALVAAAAAEPGVVFSAPYVQPYAAYSTVLSPAATSISTQSSSVIHPAPLTYSAPLAFSHYIKKRSADPQFLATTYTAPYNYNYYPAGYQYSPAAAVVSAPTVYSAPVASLPVAAHYIKKRSAEAAPEPAADPQTFFASPSYLTAGYYKPLATPYLAAAPAVSSYYNYPAAPAVPLATTHFIKKRSAEAEPEAAAEPAADPQLFRTYPAAYYPGAPLYPGYPAAAVIKSAPFYPANPFVYSTYIKK